jgi:hypothetical protein
MGRASTQPLYMAWPIRTSREAATIGQIGANRSVIHTKGVPAERLRSVRDGPLCKATCFHPVPLICILPSSQARHPALLHEYYSMHEFQLRTSIACPRIEFITRGTFILLLYSAVFKYRYSLPIQYIILGWSHNR